MKAYMLTVSSLNHKASSITCREDFLRFCCNVPYTGLSDIRIPMETTTGKEHSNMVSDQATTADSETKWSTPGVKRSWEASLSSLQSKRIRANHNNDSPREQKQSKDGSSNSLIHMETRPNGERYTILLMDIGDENKRAWLTEVHLYNYSFLYMCFLFSLCCLLISIAGDKKTRWRCDLGWEHEHTYCHRKSQENA